MEENLSNTILLELQKLNGRFDHMQEEMQNKFALIDARFNTLEEFVLTMQQDIGSLQEALQDRISAIEESLQNRISTVEETLQDRISAVEESLQNKISTVEETLQDRITTIENITLRMEYTFHDKISILFDAHSYSNDQYHKLDKRIRQNEIKIANLSLSNL